MASQIKREVRRLVPLGGGVTVQADIAFFRGSVILEGTVVLLLWAGRTAPDPVRDELADVIKTVVRRVVHRMVTSLFLMESRMEVDVNSRPPIATPAPTERQPALVGVYQRWMPIYLGILTVLVLLLLADRLWEAPRTVYLPQPTAAAPSAAPSPTPAK
jgi:hypothetical protein